MANQDCLGLVVNNSVGRQNRAVGGPGLHPVSSVSRAVHPKAIGNAPQQCRIDDAYIQVTGRSELKDLRLQDIDVEKPALSAAAKFMVIRGPGGICV
jgi:hypothetical protein